MDLSSHADLCNFILLVFMRQINVAIIGGGTVGGGVYKALRQNGRLLASRLGVQLSVTRVVVRDLRKPRAVSIPQGQADYGLEIGGRG